MISPRYRKDFGGNGGVISEISGLSAVVSCVSYPSDTNKYFISVRGWLLPNLGQLVLGNEVELSWVRLLVHGHSEASPVSVEV